MHIFWFSAETLVFHKCEFHSMHATFGFEDVNSFTFKLQIKIISILEQSLKL